MKHAGAGIFSHPSDCTSFAHRKIHHFATSARKFSPLLSHTGASVRHPCFVRCRAQFFRFRQGNFVFLLFVVFGQNSGKLRFLLPACLSLPCGLLPMAKVVFPALPLVLCFCCLLLPAVPVVFFFSFFSLLLAVAIPLFFFFLPFSAGVSPSGSVKVRARPLRAHFRCVAPFSPLGSPFPALPLFAWHSGWVLSALPAGIFGQAGSASAFAFCFLFRCRRFLKLLWFPFCGLVRLCKLRSIFFVVL